MGQGGRRPYLPLWDIPTERHLWKRQYWHLLRFFFWILQLRSHLSYTSFSRIVRRKKPCGSARARETQALAATARLVLPSFSLSKRTKFRDVVLKSLT